MAQENPLTPEKQLLNLIEKPMAKSPLNTAAIKHQGLSFFSMGALKGRFAFFKNRVSDLQSGGLMRLDIKAVNQFLKTCVVILTFYFIVNLYTSVVNLKREIKVGPKLIKGQESQSLQVRSLLKSVSYYLEKARERDIFSMIKKPLSQEPGRVRSERIMEATQNLRLVGISWSDDPDVMIEDTKVQRTFFLKKGQVFGNDIRLKAVFKDKVILSYGGEEIELR